MHKCLNDEFLIQVIFIESIIYILIQKNQSIDWFFCIKI